VTVKYKPEGYHTVTPYLIVSDAAAVIDFVVKALGGEETVRMPGPEGRIGHAEVRVGDSMIMLADTPEHSDPMPTMLHLYVEDADATYRRALDTGASSLQEPRDEFYGDRMAGVLDSVGNKWYFATHVQDISPEEMGRRAAELASSSTT
jgi:PhnB protein